MDQPDSASHLRTARRLIRIYAHTPDKETASDVADAIERCLDCPLKSLKLRCCLAREAQRWRAVGDEESQTPATICSDMPRVAH